MNYTDEQIQVVCDKVAETLKDFTVVQNYAFPTSAIISGMKAGKPAQEIAIDAYNSICNLPLYQTGFGLVGMGDSMRNVALYMQNAVQKSIESLGVNDEGNDASGTITPNDPDMDTGNTPTGGGIQGPSDTVLPGGGSYTPPNNDATV